MGSLDSSVHRCSQLGGWHRMVDLQGLEEFGRKLADSATQTQRLDALVFEISDHPTLRYNS
jgi:hypothetical protein